MWHRRFFHEFSFLLHQTECVCTAVASKYHYFHLKSLPSYLFYASLVPQLISANHFFPEYIITLKRQLSAESSAFLKFFLSLGSSTLVVGIRISLLSDMTVVIWKWHLDGRNWCTQAFNIKIRQIVWNIRQNIVLQRIWSARFCFICHRFYAYLACCCCFCCCFFLRLVLIRYLSCLLHLKIKTAAATLHKYQKYAPCSMLMLLIHISLLRSTIRYSMLDISEEQNTKK